LTLFGRTLGAEEIASLVFLSTALVIWVMAWRGERNWTRWFRGWEADRKARREAELAGQQPPTSGTPRGPWG
jgi:hypothetical protein